MISKHHILRVIVAVSILLIIAAIHAFRLGSYVDSDSKILYYSYFSDVTIPFGIYFLFCLNEIQIKLFRPWLIKLIIVFGFSTLSEILQFFDIYFLGETFDPYDIIAFAIGTGLAVFFDIVIFSNYLPFWKYNKKSLSHR